MGSFAYAEPEGQRQSLVAGTKWRVEQLVIIMQMSEQPQPQQQQPLSSCSQRLSLSNRSLIVANKAQDPHTHKHAGVNVCLGCLLLLLTKVYI